jgi:SPP1 family predicted phage head-tail adaptor
MRSGALRHRVLLQSRVETQDATGDPVVTWSDVATVWAEILPLSGREVRVENTILAEVNMKIRIRFYPGVIPKMRAVHEGVNYDITYVQNMAQMDRELVLWCESGKNNG